MRFEVLGMAVPPSPADAHERHARFHEPACDQRLLRELGRAILGANRVGFRLLRDDSEIERVVGEALDSADRGEPVLVDVRIDYSKRTRFTEGVIKTNLKRFGLADQARLVGRALWRRVTG